MENFNGHKFIKYDKLIEKSINSIIYYRCKNCNIIYCDNDGLIYLSSFNNIVSSIDDSREDDMTCNERIIKNLLE